ncbi:nucleotidyltransferase family protein [candidate division KSB1 bacterium]|nr:nucleotidyltransferase family protein [candidate division KSB1 bacterium]
MNLSDITALLLVGGLGMRLRSVVSDRPKSLASIGDRPFLALLLDQLVDAGIERTVLCTGYMDQHISHVFGESYRDMKLQYSHETTPLGTGGALRYANHLIESETVLVMNGDSFCEFDPLSFWRWHQQHPDAGSIILTEVCDCRRFGRVKTDNDNRILHFDEKTFMEVGPGWVNAGVYLLPTDWIDAIEADKQISLERDLFPHWLHHGMFGYYSQGLFIDIGTPQSYRKAEEILSHVYVEQH